MTRTPQARRQQLAAQARELQRLAPLGSIRRKAAGVLALVADDARDATAARRILTRHRLPPEVRTSALQLLDELTIEEDQQCPG